RGGQALVGQRVVVAAQRAAGGGECGGRAVVERGGVGGEGQAVVAGRVGIVGVVDLAVGLAGRVAQVGVLAEVGLDDARDRMAEHAVLGDQRQRAVLDLLQ